MLDSDARKLDLFLSTPAIWLPGMEIEEWNHELDLMAQRAQLTADFVDGRATPDQFENGLHELGVNPIEAAEAWNEGDCYQ